MPKNSKNTQMLNLNQIKYDLLKLHEFPDKARQIITRKFVCIKQSLLSIRKMFS